MFNLFGVARGVEPLLTGQWRYNQLAEVRQDFRHENEAVINDDTSPGRQIVLRPYWQHQGRIEILG